MKPNQSCPQNIFQENCSMEVFALLYTVFLYYYDESIDEYEKWFPRQTSTVEFTFHRGCSLLPEISKWVLSQTVSTKQHKNFMHFFIKTLQNCDNQSFQENSTEKVCFNESLFLYNGKALGAESSTTGCFVEKKILYFWKAFGETNHTGGLDWALCNKTW